MKRLLLSLLFCTLLSYSEAQICHTLSVNSTSIVCNGQTNGSATVTPNGGTSPYTYTWSPSGGNADIASGLSAGVYTVTVADAGTCVVTATVNIAQPNFFVAVKTQTNVLCYGVTSGIISYTAIGGTPPYSYTWSPYGGNNADATGLSPGTFTLLVKDFNNCTLTETATITGPSFSLTATTTQTNNICGATNGGASVSVTGGTGPYTYTWSPTGGNTTTATLAGGMYTISVTDANTCTTSQTVNIIQSSQPTLTAASTSISCNGGADGSGTVTPAGGTGPYTYTWSPAGGNAATASGLAVGSYTVSLNDFYGCPTFTTLTISQPAALTAATTQTNVLCNGGTGTASVNVGGGVAPYTYTWSPLGGSSSSATLGAGTYTVDILDAHLCAISRTVTLTQPPALAATGSQTNVLCFGAATGAASISVSGGVSPYTYLWSPAGGTGSLAASLLAGTYTVVARDNNTCTIIQTYTITQPTQITTVAVTSSVSCNGQSTGAATLTAGGGTPGYTYSWMPTGGTASVAASLPAGVYTIQVTDANLCVRNPTVLIAQPAALISSVSRTNVTCFGFNNGQATLIVTGGTTPYTYSWTPTGALTPSVSGLAPGNYTATVRDANLCTNLHTFTITTPGQYTITTTATSVQCAGQSTGAGTLNVSGGTPAYSYTWLPGGGSASVATSIPAGDYTVMVTDFNNCSTTRTVTIIQAPAMAGTITSSAATCNANDGSATVTVTGGTGAYSYTWTPAGGNTATATAIASGTLAATIVDQNNCQLNLLTTVATIGNSVTLSSNTSTICSGESTTLTATGSDTYTWNPSLNLSSPNGSVVTSSPTITTTYTVTGANLFGCTTTNTITVFVHANPPVSITLQTPNGCTGSTGTLNATGITSFTWSPSSSVSNAFIASPTTTLSGPLTYTVAGTNSLGCTASNTLLVTPLALPDISITASSASICIFESATFTATGANTYTWTGGPTGSSFTVAPATTTNYVVTGTGTNNCVNSATVTLGVNPLPTVSINSSSFVCQGAVATLSASGASTYSWNTGASAATITDSPGANSSYTVVGTDVNGCKATANFSLVVVMTPTMTITGKKEVCGNEKVTLTVFGASNYTWSTGQQTPTVSLTFTANTVITVSSAVGDCAPGTNTLALTVNQTPTLSAAQNSASIHAGQTVLLSAESNGTRYTWSPSEGLGCHTCLVTEAKPLTSTNYTIEAFNLNGCKTSSVLSVEVQQGCGELFAPSAFSPNFDGRNDTWCVYGSCLETLECSIFNRWGQKVFTMSSKDQCWDGTVNGVLQNSGVFIYQLQATLSNGETKTTKGNFTLVR